MKDAHKIAVVIPCYRVSGTIRDVVLGIPELVDHILVVDDACPEGSGKIAEQAGRPNVTVLYHPQNRGVGGAMVTGYQKALELGCDLVIKMDGDGQMDPAYMESLIRPLISCQADYTKGNRYTDFGALRTMPKIRLFGNNVLSFLEKVFSGYWNLMDPTNGYTAITRRTLEKLDLSKIANDYFFESHMLLHLNLIRAVVQDIPIPARYGNQNSSLCIWKTLVRFPPRLLAGLIKRIFLTYFIYDFNMASVYLLVGIPLLLWGVIFGAVEWIDSYVHGVPKTAGTIMVSALPLILSFEMLLQAIHIDIRNVPRKTSRSRNDE